MKNSERILALEEHRSKKYRDIDLDRLAVYAMGELKKMEIDLSFENGVAACFRLFPQKFSLPGYEMYPDSDRVRNCLNRCTLKNKQWLGGKALHGFKITERSQRIIQEVELYLTGIRHKETKARSQTRRKEHLLLEVQNSSAYKKYLENKKDEISRSDICYVLQGTLDTPLQTFRDNLATLKTFATDLKEEKVIEFINWLDQELGNKLQ